MEFCVIFYVYVYLQHLEGLDLLFTRLLDCDLKLLADKCVFFLARSVKFLGQIVTKHGIETDPVKIEKIKNWPGQPIQMNFDGLLHRVLNGLDPDQDQHSVNLAWSGSNLFAKTISRQKSYR